MSETLYLKMDTKCKAPAGKVYLGDIAAILCENKEVLAKARAIQIMDMPAKRQYREIFSVLWIMEKIQKQCPGVAIENIGASDFIVEYTGKKQNRFIAALKGILIGMVVLFGSGFAIMTFNNDVGIPELFERIYGLFPGSNPESHILELCYSIGLMTGIIIFYNHFGGARFDRDPTPIEVQMRNYEMDIDAAVIETAGRSGSEKDVS